jgi:hypothetical protein
MVARSTTFVGHHVFVVDSEDERRVVIEEKRCDVVVVDVHDHIGTDIFQPLDDGLEHGEDRAPHDGIR